MPPPSRHILNRSWKTRSPNLIYFHPSRSQCSRSSLGNTPEMLVHPGPTAPRPHPPPFSSRYEDLRRQSFPVDMKSPRRCLYCKRCTTWAYHAGPTQIHPSSGKDDRPRR